MYDWNLFKLIEIYLKFLDEENIMQILWNCNLMQILSCHMLQVMFYKLSKGFFKLLLVYLKSQTKQLRIL